MFYNCDGLRIQPGTAVNHWIAAAAMPDTGGDVDLRLHEMSAGPYDGFAAPRSISSWPKGSSDYVLVSFFQTPFRDFDVGAISSFGNAPYQAEYVVSAPLTADQPAGTYGPFSLGNGAILQLHEVHLLAGHLSVTVENLSDNVDLGVTLHHTSFPYQSKSMTNINPTVWINGPGENEVLFADVDQEGDYCLAVWKVGADDLNQNMNYNLTFQAVSSVENPGDTPVIARSQIRSIAPNPMNPQATIQFDLADPARAEVAVYDISGRLIQTLYSAAGTIGTQRVVWDGMDQNGSPAASGVYYVRLKAGNVADVSKVVLLK